MNARDKELAKQAGDYVNKVYTPPVRSKTPGKIWEDGHVGWHTQFNAKFADLIRADEREACAKMAEQYGPNRPIVATQPSERIKGRWEGEQAASSGISAAIRARGNT